MALEKLHAYLLKIMYLPADPRVGDVQSPRGSCKAAMVSNRANVAEAPQLHLEAAYH